MKWTDDQLEMMRRDFATTPNRVLGERLGRRPQTISKKAWEMGLRKTVRDVWTKRGTPPGWGNWGFKYQAGNVPPNRAPDGAKRTTSRGRLQVKEDGKWVPLQNHIWTAANGPVPDGHLIRFKDGNHLNFDLDNLEPATRTQIICENSIHTLPPEIAEIHRLRGLIKRTINRKERQHG